MAFEDAGPLLSSAQLLDVLARFGIGADHPVVSDSEDLARLRLSYAVLGAAEAHVLRAQSAALESGTDSEAVSHAAVSAFVAADATENTSPLWLLQARVMNALAGLTWLEPDPRAPSTDAVIDAAKLAAAATAGLIGFRRSASTAATGADENAALAGLAESASNLRRALKTVEKLLALVDTVRRARPSRN